MKPRDFVLKYYKDANLSESTKGIKAQFTLAQAALESSWGDRAVGNNLFGIKDTDGVNGNEQLLTTTEYSKSDKLKFPVILSKVLNPKTGLYKYLVKDYFRKYDTPAIGFVDHANFFYQNRNYTKALMVKDDPYKFAEEIAKAGYATAPDYAVLLKQIIAMVEKIMKDERL